MEIVILVLVLVLPVGMRFGLSKGISAETGTDLESDVSPAIGMVRRYWWLAPIVTIVSGFSVVVPLRDESVNRTGRRRTATNEGVVPQSWPFSP